MFVVLTSCFDMAFQRECTTGRRVKDLTSRWLLDDLWTVSALNPLGGIKSARISNLDTGTRGQSRAGSRREPGLLMKANGRGH